MPFTWTTSRSGNPTIPTVPYHLDEIRVLDLPHPWFRVYALPNRIFAIHEPWHAQGVISYLILGDDRALLFDTGMGISDIRPVVSTLTALPVTVVNSHTHFDHIGCNAQYGEVLAFDCAQAHAALAHGLSREELAPEVTPEQFYAPYPPGFSPETFSIQPCRMRPLSDGARLELGGRTLEVLHTPGHSEDSIMLLERSSGLLFAGDTYYPGRLFIYAPGSDLLVYRKSMEALLSKLPPLRRLHPSHNLPQDDPARLALAAECLGRIADGQAGQGVAMSDISADCRTFHFNGCSVVVRV